MLAGLTVKKVLCSDPIDKACVEILKTAGIAVDEKKLSKDELKACLKEYDALVVRSGTQVTADVIEAGTNLKIIGRAGTGVDNIDCEAATKAGVLVMNTPGGNTISAAEHTMALMMTMARHVAPAQASLKAGKWDRKLYMGTELQGKTLGILGLGRIGREVATRAQAFGMRTIGYDPIIPGDFVRKFNIEPMELDAVFPEADFITVHTPLVEATRGLVGERTLKLCKPTVRIVNCARGGIVDEAAVLKALEEGKCGGVALDVFEEEPPKGETTLKLLQHAKCYCTPHLGASTSEAQNKVAVEIANQIVAASTGKGVSGAVNAPQGLAGAFGADIRPYLALANLLGSLVGFTHNAGTGAGGSISDISVGVQGQLLHESASIVRNAALAGLLSTMCSGPVNLINAETFGKNLGITIGAMTDVAAHPNYTNLVTVNFKTKEKTHTYRATVFGKHAKRLVQVDSFHCDANLEATSLIFLRNTDQPGIAGSVGSIIAEDKVNISFLSLGKPDEEDMASSEQDTALTILGLDTKLSDAALKKISDKDGVLYARQVHLNRLEAE